ncbi:MAG: hypothetical protein KFW21_01035 [Spirochaetota bacterium]|nr:hypothetical protein [Spirochaetota bacterium]
MKRANLHSIISYTMVIMTVLIVPVYGQDKQKGSYVSQNFTLSDFGDGYDAAKSLIWKPKFSEFVVQVPKEEGTDDTEVNNTEATQDEIVVLGQNPDPARNAVRYTKNKPDGVSDLVGGPQQFVLGVKAEFTQQGYNWIELHPYRIESGNETPVAGETPATDVQAEASANSESFLLQTKGVVEEAPDTNAEAKIFRIPFAGKATELTMWVWGGYYGWWVEAYLRDYLGYQYRIPMGDLLYTGWRQKRTAIPNNIVQSRKRLPATLTLEFEMLKLWSFPSERVDQFYVYFDLLQQGSIVSTEVFNGKKLESELW